MKILVAHDGSECSDAAIVDLRRAGLPAVAQVVVLSAAEIAPQLTPVAAGIPIGGITSPFTLSEDWDATAHRPLEEARECASLAAALLRADFPGWEVSTESWVDSAPQAIARKAHAWNPDLVVVGSHGRSAIGRLVLGSVSTYVLHHVASSVRIGRHHLHSQGRPIRLLIGMDGSRDALAAVRTVAGRNWPEGTEARIVGVMDGELVDAFPRNGLPNSIEEKWRCALSATIHKAVHELHEAGLHATPQIAAGKPSKVLVAEAEKWCADTIFVGAGKMRGLERIRLGNVSTAIATQAHCSVEVVRPAMQ